MPGALPAAVPQPPSVFDGVTEALAVLVLLVVFAMMREALLRSQVRLYAFQSLAGLRTGRGSRLQPARRRAVRARLHILLPEGGRRPGRGAAASARGRGRPSGEPPFRCGNDGPGRGGCLGRRIPSRQRRPRGLFGGSGLPVPALSAAAATVLVSFALVIFRSDVVSQAVGFFSMENGVSVASLVVAARMPLILEVGFLFDLLVAGIAFGVIMRAHHRRSASLSTETLDQLRG